jgi:5'-3' exonuclease
VCARRTYRPVESPDACHLRRARGCPEVWCSPASIPDYLALVGDAADGYPGLPGWGAKSSAAVLAKFLHLESIPTDCRDWCVNAANASALADTLCREREHAMLFRTLATLRTDIALFDDADQLRWNGPDTRVRLAGCSIGRGV